MIATSVLEVPRTKVSFHKSLRGLSVIIETERLLIRSYEYQDFENYVSLYTDERLMKFFDNGNIKTLNEINQLINNGNKHFAQHEPFGLFSIFSKDNAFLGQVDLLPFAPGILEIGVVFNRNSQNQGFCLEATRAILFDYTQELKMNQFCALTVL